MSELNEKLEFAKKLLQFKGDGFAAGQSMFPEDFATAAMAGSQWVNCPVVIAEVERLTEEMGFDEFALLPTKAEFAKEVWNVATSKSVFPEEKIKALKLYGEIRGFIEKAIAPIQINNNVDNRRVMIVKEQPSDAGWESKLISQQKKLVNASANN